MHEIATSSSSTYNADLEVIHRNQCGVDVGGTLAKLVYFAPKVAEDKEFQNKDVVGTCSAIIPDEEEDFHPFSPIMRKNFTDSDIQGNLSRLSIPVSRAESLQFKYFHSKHIQPLIDFIKEKQLVRSGENLNVTGGGAYKFAECFTNELNVHLQKQDEMASIMRGLQYLLTLPTSTFRYDIEKKMRVSVQLSSPLYPFLVVNIGSGVSILKANGPNDFTRVTGTCVGGGTVLGLARLLFGATSFHEVVALSEKGEDTLDLKVGDLLGDVAGDHSLSPDTLASSFGKVCLMNTPMSSFKLRQILRKADIARSLIHMVSYNIGYLAYLVGTIHRVQRIFFAGKYIDNHAFTMESITHGVNFYTKQYPTGDCFSETTSIPTTSSDAHISLFQSTTDACSCRNELPLTNNLSPLLSVYDHQKAFLHENSVSALGAHTPNVNDGTEEFQQTKIKKDVAKSDSYTLLRRNQFEILFLRHDGYLGALGSLLATS